MQYTVNVNIYFIFYIFLFILYWMFAECSLISGFSLSLSCFCIALYMLHVFALLNLCNLCDLYQCSLWHMYLCDGPVFSSRRLLLSYQLLLWWWLEYHNIQQEGMIELLSKPWHSNETQARGGEYIYFRLVLQQFRGKYCTFTPLHLFYSISSN